MLFAPEGELSSGATSVSVASNFFLKSAHLIAFKLSPLLVIPKTECIKSPGGFVKHRLSPTPRVSHFAALG